MDDKTRRRVKRRERKEDRKRNRKQFFKFLKNPLSIFDVFKMFKSK